MILRNNIFFGLVLIVFAFYALEAKAKAKETKEVVIILHGIAKESSHMNPLAEFLESQNYQIYNLDYPSTDYKIEELIEIVGKQIKEKKLDGVKVNFIGYSMGGLITRGVLNSEYRPKNLGKVIQLASPNKGSEVADFWKDVWLYKKIFGKSGQQLGTDEDNKNLQKILGNVDYHLGIIAGNFTIDAFSSYLIKGEDDGKVSVESTKLEGMRDHIVVNSSHTFFPKNKIVHQQVLFFLKNGKFNKNLGE